MEITNSRRETAPCRDTKEPSLSLLQQKSEGIVSVFGDFESFLEHFKPAVQYRATTNPMACVMENYPTIVDVKNAYGYKVALTWLGEHLKDLSEFCGAKEKITDHQLREVTQMMVSRFYYIKVSEFMLFFQYVKEGRYGQFYGSVDPQRIMSFFHEFLQRDRARIRDDAEQVIRNAERNERREGCVSFEQWARGTGHDPNKNPIDALMGQCKQPNKP